MSSISETRRARPAQRNETRTAILFVLPFLLFYVLFLLWPIVLQFIDSFRTTGLNSTAGSQFIGLDNYRELFSDSAFWWAVWHTIWFTILTTPPLIVLGFVFALLADRVARGRWFFRLAFFAPFVMPSAVVALIWIWMYTPGLGLIEAGLNWIGVGAPNWLGDPTWAMPSLAITTIWWTLGFNFVLYLAGLQDIPHELYEAASLDGAGPWQQIRSLTIPLLGRTTTLVAVLQVIASLKVFDQMYIMTSGGPNFATRSILEYVYDEGFTNYRVGYASALSMLFFIVVLVVSAVWFWLVRNQERGA
jgi:multiple sugar transport system permease protein